MAQIQIHRTDIDFDEPMLVEGLPGVGLVGKIVADHLVSTFEMTHFGSIHCEGVPAMAIYHEGNSTVRPPVRLYADADRDLLVLDSDVPVSPSTASGFAACVTTWIESSAITPLYLSGLPAEKDDVPDISAITTGSSDGLLDGTDLDPPTHDGAISGPTGALLYEAERQDVDSIGLIVESDPQFPDPQAALTVLRNGVEPLTGIDVETEVLVERAEEIGEAKSRMSEQMHHENEESTSAQPLGMFQ